ncbi:hypothetical protein N657DRAFT_647471 [Parathielavia appendiculata]|uniref:Uncharacterized protein n=1 Tax=Parathielavia appendiculata TaxID=2587402 RepID=A0AAN6TXK5_9PEZI|nr:hypothetical protein N657DRAFT_647471 [Parathielavia appendiculata]
MAPRIERIKLYGFCWDTQERLPFNQQWACAFHQSHYTNENNPMWDSIDDPSKRREVRYANNIYVLFRALLHCKNFFGQENLWAAIARGFNTSVATAKTTAEILSAARRAHRGKPQSTVSDTARAADDWIDFVDSLGPVPRMLSDSNVYKVANAFFDSQEKKHVNAGGVPVNGRPARQAPREPREEPGTPHGRPPSPYVKTEMPRDSASTHRQPFSSHKRSPSPLHDRSPKMRRFDHDARQKARAEPERHGALDELPMIQPTQSPPRRLSTSKPAQPVPQPSAPAKREEASNSSSLPAKQIPPASAPSGPSRRDSISYSTLPTKPAQALSRPSAPQSREESLNSAKTGALKGEVASLEKQLAEAKSKPSAAPVADIPSQLTEYMGELKSSMASATNAIEVMMESMHHTVDNLNSCKDEVSGLSTQQQELAATVLQLNKDTNIKLDTILQSMQTLASTIDTLRNEVSQLKDQAPPATGTQAESTNTSQLRTLFQEQNTRMENFFREVQASLQAQVKPSQPQPQTLRQAMAAAERDLARHMGTIETFYHRGGVSRAVTEQTADVLAALSEGLRAAKAGQEQ